MIPKFIEKICVQIAVYWGDPVPDGFGTFTYNTIKEIKCRWESVNESVTNKYGKEIVSHSKILVVEDLSDEGYLYLGFISDLDSNQVVNPLEVIKAFPIQQISRVPLIRSTTTFVKTIYL